ncbi:tetratricopeptide repeat protein [Nocardia sp. NPDC020380]|uniref:tetratricopeptide repeat protein n=1 Tax=Nocardia sp. NPDC020380 TaxID=3364309 RepID=UPI0037884EF4
MFDNARDPDAVRQYVPGIGHATAIITSTDKRFVELGSPIEITSFSRQEAIAYLHERTGLDDVGGATSVAEEFGDLPLALAAASATIIARGYGFTQYLLLLHNRVRDALPRRPGQDYPRDVEAALLLAVDIVCTEDSYGLNRTLLEIISVLASDGVSRHLLYRLAEDRFVDAALERCVSGSVLSFSLSHSAVTMHPLIARVVRERLASTRRLEYVIADGLLFLGLDLHDYRPTLHRTGVVTEASAHIDALWCNAVGTENRELLAGVLDARASAVWQLTSVVANLSEAIDRGERTFADAEQVLGAQHPVTLQCRHNLGVAFHSAGRVHDALFHLGQTLRVCEEVLGHDHELTLLTSLRFNTACQSAGFDVCEAMERSLADFERVLGFDHPHTLVCRSDLALAYRDTGRLVDAIELGEQNVRDFCRILGEQDPQSLSARSNLACALTASGRHEEALPLLERVLTDRRRVLGTDHRDTLHSVHNLASAYPHVGRLDEAIDLLEANLANRERVLGTDHPDVLLARNNLAGAYLSAGRADEAVELFARALADCKRILSPGHPLTATIRQNLDRTDPAPNGLDNSARQQAAHGESPLAD